MNICGLILAAGGSSRLGRPKQLVQAQGHTLLEKAILNALQAQFHNLYVVLGANYEQILPSIQHLPISIVKNENWQAGLGSSIRRGLQEIFNSQGFDAVLIMLCDQVHVTASHLQSIIAVYQNSNAPIVATRYGKQMGVPALFDRAHFAELAMLSGDTGAKKILQQHADTLQSILFEQAVIDVDTPEDLIKNGLT